MHRRRNVWTDLRKYSSPAGSPHMSGSRAAETSMPRAGSWPQKERAEMLSDVFPPRQRLRLLPVRDPMELLIPGLILVALMVYASTRIKRTAAAAFDRETVDTEDFIIQKPEGFLHNLHG